MSNLIWKIFTTTAAHVHPLVGTPRESKRLREIEKRGKKWKKYVAKFSTKCTSDKHHTLSGSCTQERERRVEL